MTVTSSRFTPSLLPGEDLEKLFAARHHLLEAIGLRVVEAANSASRNHTLIVGPRGSGKTHMVALLHHRLSRLRIDEGLGVQFAWLSEDPWTIVSLRHVLTAIVERLNDRPPRPSDDYPRSSPDAFRVELTEHRAQKPRASAPTVADLERQLARRAKESGPIVVFIENLDQILDQLVEDEQWQLRHFLQTSGALLFVASSTSLDHNLSDQARPFYGFFTTTRLSPFSIAEATAMLTKIASYRGDAALVEYLSSEEATARLRTIEHLAGGQPRLWAALASSLTVEGLHELVDLLVQRFDDLTPYYQAQLTLLSPQQRLIIAELASADHAVHVAELAARLDHPQRSVAGPYPYWSRRVGC